MTISESILGRASQVCCVLMLAGPVVAPLGAALQIRLPCLQGVAAQTVEVRGRILRVTPGGNVPAAGLTVTFNRAGAARSAPVVSGPTGWYRFFGVRPGRLTIEVWPYGLARSVSATPRPVVRDTVTIRLQSGPFIVRDIRLRP